MSAFLPTGLSTGATTVSVVIVNFNAGSLLLESVASALRGGTEVILVDNASHDGSTERVATCFPSSAFPLKVIRNPGNLGFAAACNIGAQAATGDYILFLNPDCILGKKALAQLLDVIKTTPGTGMVGGLLLNPDGTEQNGGRRKIPTPWSSLVQTFGLTRWAHRWPELFANFNLNEQPLPDQPAQVEAISGACMMISRTALESVGQWDEGYFLHCEDLDWCMRFRLAGWKILFVPQAKVIHHQGTCSRVRPLFVEWHKHKGATRFYRKFFRKDYPGPVIMLVSLGIWLRFSMVAVQLLGLKLAQGLKEKPWLNAQSH